MVEITELVLQQMAGKIEQILSENQEAIAYANKKVDGLKLSISIILDQTAKGLELEYDLSFPLEPKMEPIKKHKSVKKEIISESEELL